MVEQLLKSELREILDHSATMAQSKIAMPSFMEFWDSPLLSSKRFLCGRSVEVDSVVNNYGGRRHATIGFGIGS